MKENTSRELAHEIFQLMKQFPRVKLMQQSYEGLSRSEYELLVLLAMNIENNHQALTVTEISNLLRITPAGVTHLINPLEEAGCIKRLQNPNDRRVVLIGLTNKGDEVARGLIMEIQEMLSGLINHLGEEDSKTLIHLMSKVINFLNA